MAEWTAGYVTEIGYTHGFYRELTPAILGFAALLKGRRPPGGALQYCELGCGQGLSANILACANPDAQFYATDFNPSQIAGAQALANEAGTPNIRFYDASFAEFADQPGLPESFDIIALHGIYSWISPENRRQIVQIIRRKLKPGGLVYISYNTLPGWSPVMPLRRLLVDAGTGPTAQRIEAALAFVERLKAAGGGYFAANPAVGQRFDKLKDMQRNYLAHEYFNRDWTPFYFGDVADELAEAKLSFMGSAHLLDHIDSINISPAQAEILKQAGDPNRSEALRDFLVNQQFRRDVFCRGSVTLSNAEAREIWLDQRFALTTPRAEIPMKVMGALGEATLQEEVYAPLLDALAAGPATLRAVIGANPAVAAISWPKLAQAVAVLAGAGHLNPALPARDDGRRAARTRKLNAALARRAESSADIQYMASPVTGGGVPVDRFGQIFLAAMAARQDPVRTAWAALEAQGQRLLRDGERLDAPEDNIADLRVKLDQFTAQRLPILRQIGVV